MISSKGSVKLNKVEKAHVEAALNMYQSYNTGGMFDSEEEERQWQEEVNKIRRKLRLAKKSAP